MKKEMSNATKLALLKLFIPLCDRSTYFEELMQDKGFKAFAIAQLFEASFGDKDHHRVFMQELAKETVASFDGSIASYSGDTATGYRSDYLAAMVSERDKRNGMSFREFQLSHPPVWELELDPCRQAKVNVQFEEPTRFQEMKAMSDRDLQQQKETESSDNIIESYQVITAYSEGEKLAILKQMMSRHLSPFGFTESKGFSSKQFPVFSKPITSSYSLCCGIKRYDDIVLQNNTGSIELVFHIRSNGFKRANVENSPFVKIKGSEYFLIINVLPIIPYFDVSYTRFFSLAEMELNVIAQITFFMSAYNAISAHVPPLLGD